MSVLVAFFAMIGFAYMLIRGGDWFAAWYDRRRARKRAEKSKTKPKPKIRISGNVVGKVKINGVEYDAKELTRIEHEIDAELGHRNVEAWERRRDEKGRFRKNNGP